MSESQSFLVRNSWNLVSGELEDLSAIFVKQLSQLKPELKPLLKKLLAEQRLLKTVSTIDHLVNSLSDLRRAEKNVLLLIASYSDMRITREDYDIALIAFLMTLEKKIGRKWTLETRDAWIFTFVTIYQHFVKQLDKPITLLKSPILTDQAA